MSTYFKDVPGYIKFIALIDRENNPFYDTIMEIAKEQ